MILIAQYFPSNDWIRMKSFVWVLFSSLALMGIVSAQTTLYLHDFGSTAISSHPYTVAPGTFNARFSSSSWSNSVNAWTSFSGAAGQAIALSNSSGTPTITLTFSVESGYQVEITALSFWRQRSSTGAQNFSVTINSIAATSGTVPTTGANTGSLTPTNTIAGLTGTVTVVISLSGASGTGTFRLDDFSLTGNVTTTSVSEPTTQASNISFTSVGANQMTLNWTNGNGSNRVVVMKSGGAVDADPSDAATYTANTIFGSGSQIGTGNYVVYNGTGTSVTVTGLSASTTYYARVYEYNGSSGSEDYYTATATNNPNSQSTTASVSSSSNIVTANNETSNIAYASYQSSSINTTADAVRVWSFTIQDGGGSADADAFDTELTAVTIGKSGGNTVTSWASRIRQAALFDGSTKIAEVSVTGETISFTGLSGSNVSAADDGSKTLDLYLTFETTATDNNQYGFLITSATQNPAKSQFAAADAGGASSSVAGDANRVEVTATKLAFSTQPSSLVEVNADFSAAVQAQDANGNVDLDATTSVTLTKAAGSGSLTSSSGLTKNLTAGAYSWTDLKYNTVESGVQLGTTNTGSLSNAASTAFQVYSGISLLVEDFSYTAGDSLKNNGWSIHSGSTDNILVSNSGLTYAGYAGSEVGNAANMFGTGIDVNRGITTQNQNGTSLYLSAMVNVTDAIDQSGTYFMHLGARASETSFTNFCARVWVKVVSNNVQFGISNSTTATYGSSTYSKNSTYLLVVKYTINTSGADPLKLWVLSSGVPASEAEAGTAEVTISGETGVDSINAVALRQATGLPDIIVDGIRIATSWGSVPLPVELTSFTASSKGKSVELTWQTASEQNNFGFNVEQSFNNEWRTIGFVEGSGTVNVPKQYSFTTAVPVSGSYFYRLKQIDRDGKFHYSPTVEVQVNTIVNGFELAQNYPNPFNPSTTIAFSLAKEEFVTLKVYDVLGKEVETLVEGKQSAGTHFLLFDASELSSGIYFYSIRGERFNSLKKMMFVK